MKRSRSDGEVVLSISEQSQLQHTAVLVNSSLFKLQVEQLLGEVNNEKIYSSEAVHTWITEFIDNLKSASESAVGDGALPASLSNSWVESINESFPSSAASDPVNFVPINEIQCIGSFSTRTITHPITNIDLAFTIPEDAIPSNESIIDTYGFIRTSYVAAIATLIRVTPNLRQFVKGSVDIARFKDDAGKPIIRFIANLARKHQIVVRLMPVVSLDLVPLTKLIRQLPRVTMEDGSESVSSTSYSQKQYEIMSILEDGAIIPQHRLLTKLLEAYPVGRRAILLLKTWLAQRGFRFGADFMDGYQCSLLVCYLLFAKTGEIKSIALKSAGDELAASILVFQAVISFLSKMDCAQPTVLNFNTQLGSKATKYSVIGGMDLPELCQTLVDTSKPLKLVMLHPIVGKSKSDIFDYNSLWRVSNSALNQLKQEAKNSLQIMQSDDESSFHKVFMDKASFFHRSDLYFACPLQSVDQSGANVPAAIMSNYIHALCLTALGNGSGSLDRVSSICVAVRPDINAKVDGDTRNGNTAHYVGASGEIDYLHIGLVLNPSNANRRVDRGPSATVSMPDGSDADGAAGTSSTKISSFQQFWGGKCQLRRFQDGSIVEAVVWDSAAVVSLTGDSKKRKHATQTATSMSKVDSITEQILKHVLSLHAESLVGKYAAHLLLSSGSVLEKHLPSPTILPDAPGLDPRLSFDYDAMVRRSIDAVDQLREVLASKLTDLPLAILSVMAACPELRYTSTYPALPHPFLDTEDLQETLRSVSGHQVALVVQPLSIIGTLESSGKWPAEREARQNSITAFLFRISELLAAQFKIKSTPQANFLDINFMGFIFRLRLRIDVSTSVTAGAIEDDDYHGLCPHIDEYEYLILHHQAVRSLCSIFPAYAPAVRLMQLWVDSIMLSGHVTIPMIEILVASVFVNLVGSTRAPTTPSAAFSQALFRLISWNWQDEPLCVDLTPKVESFSHTSASHINGLKTAFISRFRKIKREVQSSGAKHIIPSICLVALYNDDSAAGAVKSRLAHFFIDQRSLVCLEPATMSVLLNAASLTSNKLLFNLISPKSLLGGDDSLWMGLDNAVIQSCNVLLKFRRSVCCSTGADDEDAARCNCISLSSAAAGPSAASTKVFMNMPGKQVVGAEGLIIRESPTVTSTQAGIVDAIRTRFHDVAIVFWNAARGDVVGLVWKPKEFLSSNFSILDSRDQLLVPCMDSSASESGASTVMNVAKIIAEILDIGGGLFGDVRIK